ncbi:MAG: putative ABC transporter permease [Ruminococcus sp.]|nr:putative ABC transporter permease [Ruminococcus sp.]
MTIATIKEKQYVQKFFLCFMMYAVLGWCYEVILETFIYRWGFTNRGVLFGPYCPVYGVGALSFLLCFNTLMKKKDVKWLNIVKPLIIFVGCMAVATLIELAASYILEFFTGAWPWQTYADYKYNFQARIALSTSLRFGLGGTLFLYIVQPFFDWLLSKLDRKTLNIIAVITAAVVLIDCVYTFLIK